MKRTHIIIYVVAAILLLAIIVAGILTITAKQQTKPQADESSQSQTEQTYTLNEVAAHDTRDDCWTMIDGLVYDLTSYVNRHPGGDELLRACGQESTTLFNLRRTESGQNVGSGTPHSQNARELLESLKIGTLQN